MAYSQEGRPIQISTTLGETELLLEWFTGTESVSAPFEFQVGLLSENSSVNLKSLLHTAAVISLQLPDGQTRYIHGIFNRLTQLEQGKDKLVAYAGTLVPSIWFLGLYADCRIFQNLSVPDIVEQVLSGRGVTDFKLKLNGSYPQREYCVQYRESDLNFISRLLEEEGIFYFFEHTKSKHTLVIADRPSAFSPCQQATVRYSLVREGWGEEDSILTLERIEEAHTSKIALEDYDFEKPNVDLKVSLAGNSSEEVYDYPGGYLDRSEGERYARVRLEEQETPLLTVRGTSRCRALQAGYRFTLADHYREDANVAYAALSVTHEATDNNYRAPQSEPFAYRNSFEAVPQSVAYRPPRRARKPVVEGPQTAMVVGKSGEEIWVDKYGRVIVQFYWDRTGHRDEKSSCWVRVAQPWAGKNWGWITLPRIGQEVVVDFLEGDPDRPLITGRVYNADQMPPYTLPDNQTQSGIKSRSSKGGGAGNFNEIRFEDKMGGEMFTVHAEKDMETVIEHDDTQTVQNDRIIEVDGKHTETITGDMSITIKTGDHSLSISTGKSTTEAAQSIELTVGPSSLKMDPSGIVLQAPMIQVKGSATVTIQGGMVMIN
jgi:type VI secretion system secreted protein VgrG